MKNYLLSTWRSLRKNKLIVISLTFLLFLAVFLLTILRSTVANVETTYTNIATTAKMHDMTINEQYRNDSSVQYKLAGKLLNPHVYEDQDKYWCTPKDALTGVDEYVYNDTLPSYTEVKDSNNVDCYEFILAINYNAMYENNDPIIEYINSYVPNSSPETKIKDYDFIINPANWSHATMVRDLLYPKITIAKISDSVVLNYKPAEDQINTSLEKAEDIRAQLDKYASEIISACSKAVNNLLHFVLNNNETPLALKLQHDYKNSLTFQKNESLNIDNTSDNIFYKVIKSNPTDIIDKMYLLNYNNQNSGQENFDSINDFKPFGFSPKDYDHIDTILNCKVANGTDDQTIVKKAKLLAISEYSDSANKLFADGTLKEIFKTDINDADAIKNLAIELKGIPTFKDFDNAQLVDTGYKYTLQAGGTIPKTAVIENWTSVFGVLGPQYADAHKITPANHKDLLQIQKETMKDNILKDLISEDLVHNFNLMNTKEINKFVDNYIFAHPDSTITIDNGIPIIVIGLGITPEYIYPLTTVEKINPNVAKEALIFPNSAGYKRIHTSFESNTTENYVACKFIEGLSDNTKTNILDNINVWAKQNFIDAGFDKPAMMFNDTSNIKNASAIRISLIPQLMNTINTISNILVLFILIVSVLVAYIAIVKYIKNQRKSIAILVANGVSKTKIAFSLLPFALLPSIIGGICGYIFGLVLQLPALLMFKSYWTIPTTVLGFDAFSLAIAILVPFIIVSLISYISTLITLNEKTVDLIKNSAKYKVNIVNVLSKKMIARFSILTKFRISLAFNSISKLTLLTIVTSLTVSTLLFSFTTFNKINDAGATSFATKNYAYQFDLYTPTSSGGQYIPVRGDNWGEAGVIETSEGKNFMPGMFWDGYKPDASSTTDYDLSGYGRVFNMTPVDDVSNNINISKKYVNYKATLEGDNPKDFFTLLKNENTGNYALNSLFPMGSDNLLQLADLQYLKNKTLDQLSTDYMMGVDTTVLGLVKVKMGANPWNIVKALAPDNEINKLKHAKEKVLDFAGYKMFPKAVEQLYGIDGSGNTILINGSDPIPTGLVSPYDNDDNKWIDKTKPDTNNIAHADNSFIIPIYFYDGHWCYGKYDATKLDYNYANLEIDTRNGGDKPYAIPPDYNPTDYNPDVKKITDVKFVLKNNNAIDNKISIGFPVQINAWTHLKLNLIKFITKASTDLKISTDLKKPISELKSTDLNVAVGDEFFNVSYNSVPLHEAYGKYLADETYTYLEANSNKTNDIKVYGLKPNTQYVELKNAKGEDLRQLLKYSKEDKDKNKEFPLIVNAYAARKNNLKIGDVIKINALNHVERINEKNKKEPAKHEQAFKVMDINQTFVKEEYYTSQDVANYCLGLKSHLDPYNEPHAYYIDSKQFTDSADVDGNKMLMSAASNHGKGNQWGYQNVTPLPTDARDPKVSLWDISHNKTNSTGTNEYSGSSIFKENTGIETTPYGFNGVFTQQSNGSNIINNTIALYSPSGLYLPNEYFNSNSSKAVIEYGSNAMILCQIAGLWFGENKPENTDIGNKVYEAWKKYMADPAANRKTNWSQNFSQQLISELSNRYGNVQFTNIVQSGADKASSSIVFNNLSQTVNSIEILVICIVLLMVVFIVLMVIMMIINDGKNLMAILKTLGYRDSQNLASFLSIYIPLFILSIIISIPLTFAVLALYNNIVFNFIGILIFTNIEWLAYLVSFLVVVFLFGISSLIGYASIKKEKLVARLKDI